MQHERRDGRRPIGGTSSDVRPVGRHECPRGNSLDLGGLSQSLNIFLVAQGAMLFAVCLLASRVSGTDALAIAVSGLFVGLGLGAALSERG